LSKSQRVSLIPVAIAALATACAPHPGAPTAGAVDAGKADAGQLPTCYFDSDCASGRCTSPVNYPTPVVNETDPPGDISWPAADLTSVSATNYNLLDDVSVRFAATPFDPARHQILTVCIDSDKNPLTGTACGSGDLAGADAAFTYDNGILQSIDVLNDSCQDASFDLATRTVHFGFDLQRFPSDHRDEVFRYVVLSTITGASQETDSAPDHPSFARSDGYLSSRHEITFWYPPEYCCSFSSAGCRAGVCAEPN